MAANYRRELTIVLTGDAKGLTGTVRLSTAELQKFGQSLDDVGTKGAAGGLKASAGLKAATAQADQFGAAVTRLRSRMVSFISIAAAGLAVRGLGRMADEYANIGAQMRQAAGNAVSFATAQATAFGVAQRTTASLASTAALISNIDRSLGSLGEHGAAAFQKSAALAETINQAIALSHVGAASADAALVQLNQGLASGTLRGDELNSVMEQTPRLAQAIADGMGITIGKLRAMGEAGMITSQTVVHALVSQRAAIAASYADLPLTIGRSWTKVTNALEAYVGTADQAEQGSRHLADLISAIGDHVGVIADAVLRLGEVVAAVYAGNLLINGAAWIASLKAQAAATAALGAAEAAAGATGAAGIGQSIKQLGLLRGAGLLAASAFAGWQIGSYLYDQFAIVREAGAVAIGTILGLWIKMKEGAQLAWLGIKDTWISTLAAMRIGFLEFLQGVASSLQNSVIPGLKTAGQQLAASVGDSIGVARTKLEADLTGVAIARLKVRAQADKELAALRANVFSEIDYEHQAVVATTAATVATATNTKAKTAAANAAAVAAAAQASQNEKLKVQAGLLDAAVTKHLQMRDAIDDERMKLQGLSQAQIQFADGTRDAVRAYNTMIGAGIDTVAANEQLRQTMIDLGDQYRTNSVAATASATAVGSLSAVQTTATSTAERYYQVIRDGARNVADTIAGVFVRSIHSAADLWRGMVDVAKSVVQQIISTFLQLRLLQPILGSIFGTGYSGGGAGAALVATGQAFGLGGTHVTTGGGAGGSNVGSYISDASLAYKGYGWLTGGAGALTGGTIAGNSLVYGQTVGNGVMATNLPGGALAYTNATGQAIGYSTPYAPYGGAYTTAGGYAVPYASIAGGAVGAYYGYNHAGGGVAGVAAGVSYGALGAGIAGTAAGVAGGASLGTAAAGAYGAIAGASWIPVVGWILAALAVVDAVSGGKLFGTKYAPSAALTSLNLSPAGASAQQFLTKTKQGSLFSGKKSRTDAVTPSQAVQDSAQSLYDTVSKSMAQAAAQLDIAAPAIITAQLQIAQKIHKGKVKSTDYLVQYLGRTWKEATADAAAQRIGAEALVTTVAASAGQVAQTIAEQWRKSADTLLDGAQTMLAAQTDITKGNALLATGAGATLDTVIKFVEKMQVAGDTLAATYARLQQANQAYLSFVSQFEKAVQGAGLGAVLAQINQAMQSDLAQANALAQAAGLSGAREQDLANIHTAAAQQVASAMAAMGSAADQLASKLYATTGHTLVAVQAQIDALQAKVQGAAQLALGDTSIYTDRDKLGIALKGLQSGVVSAQDVLSIGQRLYGGASSQYRALYGQVSQIAGLPSTTTDLSGGLDQLAGLTAQRDQMQSVATAAQRVTDAKTLASYVADLSSVRGQDFGTVAGSLGFSLQDLAKDLGVSNIGDYLNTLANEDIPGALGDAKDEIVNAVRGIGDDIVRALVNGPLLTVPTPPQSTGTQIDNEPPPVAYQPGGATSDDLLNKLTDIQRELRAGRFDQQLGRTGSARGALVP